MEFVLAQKSVLVEDKWYTEPETVSLYNFWLKKNGIFLILYKTKILDIEIKLYTRASFNI